MAITGPGPAVPRGLAPPASSGGAAAVLMLLWIYSKFFCRPENNLYSENYFDLQTLCRDWCAGKDGRGDTSLIPQLCHSLRIEVACGRVHRSHESMERSKA